LTCSSLKRSVPHHDLHSFPTRRSSDLRDKHPISRKDISEHAIKVLYRLHNSGYQAFLVGGCVRDLILGLHPKDFDIATNATPEEDRKSTRLNSSHVKISYAVFCLKKKK